MKRRRKEGYSSEFYSTEVTSSLALFCEKLINDEKEVTAEYSSAGQVTDRLRSAYLDAINVLQDAIHNLYTTGQQARQVLEGSASGGTSPGSRRSNLEELVGYAHKLSFTTSAPAGFVPGKDFLGLFKPPAPQEPQMQISTLHNLPSKSYLEGPSAVKDDKGTPDQPSLADILSKLPPMPAGWKPGDPIPGLPTAPVPSSEAPHTVDGDANAKKAEPALAPAVAPDVSQKEVKEEKMYPFSATRTMFDFALNPDLEMVFEGSEKESEESEDDSDF